MPTSDAKGPIDPAQDGGVQGVDPLLTTIVLVHVAVAAGLHPLGLLLFVVVNVMV